MLKATKQRCGMIERFSFDLPETIGMIQIDPQTANLCLSDASGMRVVLVKALTIV